MSSATEQRRHRILNALFEKKHVTARDLATDMAVSEATVRRDLRALADNGHLDLVYGGATLPRPGDYSFRSKVQRNVEAKRIIGQLAAELVADSDQIFLDSGTTCFEMAAFLKRKRGLFVIVNSARLAMELESPGLNVILLGGLYRPDRMDTTGPLATATLDQLRGFVAFVGADGIDTEFGPAAADMESAHLYGLAVHRAREAILLVDHTKFTAPSLFRVSEWKALSRVVTDQRPPQEWMDFLESQGIDVVYPQPTPEPATEVGQQLTAGN